MLWLLNGVIFYVLLFATGQWHRIVPTTRNGRRRTSPGQASTAAEPIADGLSAWRQPPPDRGSDGC
jgi:hypothetical protein